ncbi:MAG: GNAT family N-acetyltransferase [Rhizobiales bacterium]|nr:GNAT family N-acetyltransferase [Hyphomicrobiales bacterium]NRB13857.1 GNAT family N-acetyltransferase [Hyphomicrobiales bacterium]
MQIVFETNPNENDVKTVFNGLVEFNKPVFNDDNLTHIACFCRDDEGKIRGGATGLTVGNIAMIRYLWIADELRGQGIGGQIFETLEAEFKQRGITEIHLDTYSFQAPEFYKKLGFEEVARYVAMKDKNIDKIFLIKQL